MDGFLTEAQVQDFGLPKGRLYGQFFLLNTKMNNAGDPAPFKVSEKNFAGIVKSFEGKPFLIPPKTNGIWNPMHFRSTDPKKIFNEQKAWAAGEIIATHINDTTGNANAIVEFFPEYEERIKNNDLPMYTSPMLNLADSDTMDNIVGAVGVHLQAVPEPGYPAEISQIKSLCIGGLSQCMSELKIVAASGDLAILQEGKRFSNAKNMETETVMDQQMEQTAPTAPAGNPDQRIAVLEKGFMELQKMVQALMAKLGGQPAAPTAPQVGASAQAEELVTMKSELEKIRAEHEAAKKEIEAEKAKLALDERVRIATDIIESKIKLHRIDNNSREAEIKKLVDMKNANDEPVDLTLLATELKSSLKQLVGASGNYLELEVGTDNSNIDYARIAEVIGQ